MEQSLELRGELMLVTINTNFLENTMDIYANEIEDEYGALGNCVGFIDGTAVGIWRPENRQLQAVVYNGLRRKHSLT